jgi:hypothetical protein
MIRSVKMSQHREFSSDDVHPWPIDRQRSAMRFGAILCILSTSLTGWLLWQILGLSL